MSKIPMIRRNRVVHVDARLAPLLARHGGYQRRDMQAQSAEAPPPASPAQPDNQALEAKRAAEQAKRDAAAAKAAAKPAAKQAPNKAARKAVAKAAANKPAPEKDASE